MRLRAWAWFAASSLILAPLAGETRPHYGGTLTVEVTALESAGGIALPALFAEPLVRINSRGQAEPVLAAAWQHDADFKRWRISLRPKVSFHDGEPLTAASALPSLEAALKPTYGDVTIQAGGQALVIQSRRAMPDLLEELALPGAAITRKGESDVVLGTGPFRVTSWEPRRVTLAAFDNYWGGRPFLDGVSVEVANGAGRADIVEIPAGPTRRILPEGWRTWSSTPRTLVALEGTNADAATLSALAQTIDRAPIANVLAQHKADPAFGLLPQWMSAYAFLFASTPDVARAKQAASALRAGPVSLSSPPNDVFLRSVADRIALHARDAGIAVQLKSGGSLRLVERPMESADAAHELRRIAIALGAADRVGEVDPTKPESLYQLEKFLLDEHRIVPLIHLRESYGISPRIHFHSSDPFVLHLEDAWVQP